MVDSTIKQSIGLKAAIVEAFSGHWAVLVGELALFQWGHPVPICTGIGRRCSLQAV